MWEGVRLELGVRETSLSFCGPWLICQVEMDVPSLRVFAEQGEILPDCIPCSQELLRDGVQCVLVCLSLSPCPWFLGVFLLGGAQG